MQKAVDTHEVDKKRKVIEKQMFRLEKRERKFRERNSDMFSKEYSASKHHPYHKTFALEEDHMEKKERPSSPEGVEISDKEQR